MPKTIVACQLPLPIALKKWGTSPQTQKQTDKNWRLAVLWICLHAHSSLLKKRLLSALVFCLAFFDLSHAASSSNPDLFGVLVTIHDHHAVHAKIVLAHSRMTDSGSGKKIRNSEWIRNDSHIIFISHVLSCNMSCALKLRLLLKSVFCRLRLFSELFVLFPVPCLLNLQLQHLESWFQRFRFKPSQSKEINQELNISWYLWNLLINLNL